MERRAAGLTLLRMAMGLFLLCEGIGKIGWFADPSILARQLAGWQQGLRPDSLSHQYLLRVAMPFVWLFARLVPLGELTCGAALLTGFWTPVFAALAFLMALNFHVASGTLFRYAFLTNGYGLPVLGGTLALAVGGVRLPWSLRR